MSDAVLLAGWCLIFAGGILACRQLVRWSVPSTYVRDVLHVGAGSWVFGWPLWRSSLAPVGLCLAALIIVSVMPLLRGRIAPVDRAMGSVAGGDERWTGLPLYCAAFVLCTLAAWRGARWPAAAALLSLAWGDGIGGWVGRRFGIHTFRLLGKRKSWEGTAAVFVFSFAGAFVARRLFAPTTSLAWVLAAAGAGAALEAVAPAATDNVLMPIGILGLLRLSNGWLG